MAQKLIFGDFPKKSTEFSSSKIVLLPVPYDGTSTYVKGADKGPNALIVASPNLEFYDIETKTEVWKNGIYTSDALDGFSSPEEMVARVEAKVMELLNQGKFVALIGGEHSVSIGSIYAHAKKFKDVSVLQLDAHSDFRDEYHGSKNNHACVMSRAKEVANIVQVGIRSTDISEQKNMAKGSVFYAKDIYNNKKWVKKAISKLKKKVYLTIDLDVFDPSLFPSTGTPEPGGLFWYDVIEFMHELFKTREVIGLDLVELCPNEQSKSSDFIAAKLLYTLLTYKFALGKKIKN
ncbi:MAG: agmatinase [archaeon]